MRFQNLVRVVMVISCGCAASPGPPPRPVETSHVAKPPVAASATPAVPEREDFEAATIGSLPPGWAVVGPAKDIAFAAARIEARTVLQIVTTGEGSGSIKRPLDVARYRGKRIQITAHASCEPVIRYGRAAVGVDVFRPGTRGYGDRARTDRIEAPAWQDYVVIADVAGDATGLDLVVSASGAAKTGIDDITISVLGNAGAGDEPPRVLEGRALANVVAFARLYGIVRYFHPSDEVAALDDAGWERFVIRGVRAVERAPDPAALRVVLEQLFAPVAPSVALHREGEQPPATQHAAAPSVHWIHRGVGLSKDSVYRSTRGAVDMPSVITITASIDPALVRGREIKVALRAHAKLGDERADVGLWIAEQAANGQEGFSTEPEAQPAIGATWTEIRVNGRISADAKGLALGVQAIGNAEAWLETPVVTIDGKPLALAGWGSPGRELADSWNTSGDGFVAVGDKGCDRRRVCVHVTPTPIEPPDRRPWLGALGGGVAASVPLELSTRDGKTVPAATASLPAPETAPLLATDRATRLAAVIIAWNVFQHFYPYFDVRGTDWMPELPQRLAEAAIDNGPAALQVTLRRLVHELHDGHGTVVHPSEDRSWFAPWLWERVEGRLVITQVSERCACDLAPGDVVTAIDGEATEHATGATGALFSAATEQHRNEKVLRRLRTGPEGGRLRVTVERGGVSHDVEVALVEPSAEPKEKRPASGDEIAPGIRYVDIDRVTDEQWSKIVPDLAAAKAVVCDMRGYPNQIKLTTPLAHFTRRQISSAQWHIPTPTRPDRDGLTFGNRHWTVQPKAPFVGHVVFLTDGRAVSAAETFMGIVEASKLGPIVGAATAGTNGNINPFKLPGGYLVWWTGMRVLKQDGSRHHGVGILPTVSASRTLAGIAARRDEVLEKGIDVAQQLTRSPANHGERRH